MEGHKGISSWGKDVHYEGIWSSCGVILRTKWYFPCYLSQMYLVPFFFSNQGKEILGPLTCYENIIRRTSPEHAIWGLKPPVTFLVHICLFNMICLQKPPGEVDVFFLTWQGPAGWSYSTKSLLRIIALKSYLIDSTLTNCLFQLIFLWIRRNRFHISPEDASNCYRPQREFTVSSHGDHRLKQRQPESVPSSLLCCCCTANVGFFS